MSQAIQDTQPKVQEPAPENMFAVHFSGIPAEWNESHLVEFITSKLPDVNIASVRVVYDRTTGKSRRYAYINLPSDSAIKLINVFNHVKLNDKELSVATKRTERPPPEANLYANHLNLETTYETVEKKFNKFGRVLSTSKREYPNKCAFCVQYEKVEEAKQAISNYNGTEIDGATITVAVFIPAEKREKIFTNILVKNIAESVTEAELREKFSEIGAITSVYVFKNADGSVKYKEIDGKKFYQAAINFEKPEDAANATEKMNGYKIKDSEVIVARHLNRKQRKNVYNNNKKLAIHPPANNVYLNGVGTVDEKELRARLQTFGAIDSLRLMTDEKGERRPYGYCSFFDKDSAERAVGEHSIAIGGVPVTLVRFKPKPIRVHNYVKSTPKRSVNKPKNKTQQKRIPHVQQEQVEAKLEAAVEAKLEAIPTKEFSTLGDDEKHEMLGEKIYDFVSENFKEENAGKITGMILESFKESLDKLNTVIEKGEINEKIKEAIDVLKKHSQPAKEAAQNPK